MKPYLAIRPKQLSEIIAKDHELRKDRLYDYFKEAHFSKSNSQLTNRKQFVFIDLLFLHNAKQEY